MPTPVRTPSDRLLAVDCLRGVAALLVLLHHLPEVTGVLRPLRPLQSVGFTGVGLFLVVSGFSIHFRWAQTRGEDFDRSAFWHRRFWRLYPTYMAATAVALIIAIACDALPGAPHLAFDSAVATPWVALILSQVVLVAANVIATPLVGVSWSLGLETQLYAAYILVAGKLRSLGIQRVMIGVLVVTLLCRIVAQCFTTSVPVGQFLPDGSATLESRFLYQQLPARWFEWMLGVAVAEAYWNPVRRVDRRVCGLSAIALLVAGAVVFRHPVGSGSIAGHRFFWSDVLLDPVFGLGYAALLLVAVVARPSLRAEKAMCPLAFVGIFSYSLYLLHGSLITLADRVWPTTDGTVPQMIRVAVALSGSWLFFQAVEKHFLFARRWPTPSTAGIRRLVVRVLPAKERP